MSNKKKNLIERLNSGPVLCAEGYLFAMERRGYLQAGVSNTMVKRLAKTSKCKKIKSVWPIFYHIN